MTPKERAKFESLIRIRNLTELKPFRDMLEEDLAAEVKAMTSQTDTNAMLRAQGAVRALTKINQLIEDSRGVLEKERPQRVGNV